MTGDADCTRRLTEVSTRTLPADVDVAVDKGVFAPVPGPIEPDTGICAGMVIRGTVGEMSVAVDGTCLFLFGMGDGDGIVPPRTRPLMASVVASTVAGIVEPSEVTPESEIDDGITTLPSLA